MPERSILVLFAHPAFERSRVQRRLLEAPTTAEAVTVRDLYQCYPDFEIDVAAEQALLLEHDTVIVQHPLYWYSVPPLVRQWQDLVLTHGWAYGNEGRALAGKRLMHVISAGGSEAAYQASGQNRFTIDELLRPCEQTAVLCGMTWMPPLVVFGTHRMGPPEIDEHVERYRDRLARLQRDPAADRSSHAR